MLRLVASTSDEAQLLEVFQLRADEGPCLDCFRSGAPITEGDLEANISRWPQFSAEAVKQGFRSVHSTPLRLRGHVIGTMNLFGQEPGELAAADQSVAQALADVATIGILHERVVRDAELSAQQLQLALDSRVVLEQAKGVLVATSEMTMDQAFAAMRHYARDTNQTLRTVAHGVVARSIDIHNSPRVLAARAALTPRG